MDISQASLKIKKYISHRAITQTEFANEVGVQQSKISYIINGKCKRYNAMIKRVTDFIDSDEIQKKSRIPSTIENQISKFLSNNPGMEKPLSNIISNLSSIAKKE